LEIITMKKIIAILAVLVVSTGCTTVNLRRADEISVVKRGVVTDRKEVTLAGTTSGAGGAAGAVVGTAIGASGSGGSFTRAIVGSLVGNVVGAFAGNAAEKKLTETDGIELTVKLDGGEEVAVAQRREIVERIAIGDSVRITQSGPRATVEKVTS
jgi:outer membrane lipoprotein SlyB